MFLYVCKQTFYLSQVRIRNDKHMLSMKTVQFSNPPTPLVHPPSWLWTSNFKRIPPHPHRPLPSSPNGNKSIKRKHNPRITIIYYKVLPSIRSSFVFSMNSLILHGFPLASFHLAEASLSAFSWLYTLVCAVVQKYHEMSFIFNYSHL